MKLQREWTVRSLRWLSNLYSRTGKFILALILISLGIYFAGRLYWATGPLGMGIDSDSVYYIWSARNLAAGIGLGRLDGDGLLRPMTHWPPLYPILLAGFEAAGIGAVEGARWLGVFACGANVVLVGFILYRLTRSAWLSSAGALLMAVFPMVVQTNLWALTEPLYIFFSLLSFLALDRYARDFERKWGIALGVCLGLAFLTRYVGLALIGVCTLVILIRSPGSILRRLQHIWITGLAALLPVSLWMVRNTFVAGTPTNRALQFIPISTGEIAKLKQTLDLLIYQIGESTRTMFDLGPGKLGLAVAVLLTFLVFRHFDKIEAHDRLKGTGALWLGILVYECAYPLFVGISRTFFDPNIPIFLDRILAPLLVNSLILVFAGFYRIWLQASSRSAVAAAILLVVGAYFMVSITRGYASFSNDILTLHNRRGIGLSFMGVGESPFIKAVQKIPQNSIIYTDNIEHLYYLSGRSSYMLFQLDEKTAAQIRLAVQRKGGAAIAVFHAKPQTIQQIHTLLPEFNLVYQDSDGLIAAQP